MQALAVSSWPALRALEASFFLLNFNEELASGNDLSDVSGASKIQKHGHKHVDCDVAWKKHK